MCGAPGSVSLNCLGVRSVLVNSVSSKPKPRPGIRSIAMRRLTPGEFVSIGTAGFANGVTFPTEPEHLG